MTDTNNELKPAGQVKEQQTRAAVAQARGHIRDYVKQLRAISQNPDPERVIEITSQTVREVFFSALQHLPVTITGHAYADATLRQAATTAALQAREAVHPAISCNIHAARLNRSLVESPEQWMHRNAPVLQAAGQVVRDVYQAMLTACTDALGQHNDTKAARQQALDLAASVSAVMDTVTNTPEVRKRMPAPPADYSPLAPRRRPGTT